MRIIFDRENIVPGLPGVVLLSHGGLAAGLLDTAQLILGEQENIAAICLEPGDDIEAYAEALGGAVEAFGDCVLLLDIRGGTPCNQTLRYAKRKGRRLHAMTGMNLPMLLEALTARDGGDTDEISLSAMEAASEGCADLYDFLAPDQQKG